MGRIKKSLECEIVHDTVDLPAKCDGDSEVKSENSVFYVNIYQMYAGLCIFVCHAAALGVTDCRR